MKLLHVIIGDSILGKKSTQNWQNLKHTFNFCFFVGYKMEKTEKIPKKEVTGLGVHICVFQEGRECADCNLDEITFCKPKPKYPIMFGIPFVAALIAFVVGIAVSGIPLWSKIVLPLVYLGYMFFFLMYWESQMLCNHCPYYANDSEKFLNCAIDKGKMKTGKYNPGPLSKSERIQLVIGFMLLTLLPIAFLLIADATIALVLTMLFIIIWFIVLETKVCTSCINFACLLNKTPDEVRNKFFNKNPIIKEAWEKAGYKFDEDKDKDKDKK